MSAQDSQLTVISDKLTGIAQSLRADVLRMVHVAGAGHIAGPLSAAEVMATLYFGGIVDLSRDKIILSCGHYAPLQYAAIARAGYMPMEELLTYMKAGGRLPGHPERGVTPGIEVSTGSLGQGVSVAVGMALGEKLKAKSVRQRDEARICCVLSDGEIQEGQVWEAFNFAVRRQLDNLILILDRNRVQIEHFTSEVATYGGLEGRFEAFGLHTLSVNGHNPAELIRALQLAKEVHWAPSLIVAKTVAGRGVSFMENKPEWHDKVLSSNELEKALLELGET